MGRCNARSEARCKFTTTKVLHSDLIQGIQASPIFGGFLLSMYKWENNPVFHQMLTLNYEYKLEPTKAQAAQIDEWLEICRKVDNSKWA